MSAELDLKRHARDCHCYKTFSISPPAKKKTKEGEYVTRNMKENCGRNDSMMDVDEMKVYENDVDMNDEENLVVHDIDVTTRSELEDEKIEQKRRK